MTREDIKEGERIGKGKRAESWERRMNKGEGDQGEDGKGTEAMSKPERE